MGSEQIFVANGTKYVFTLLGVGIIVKIIFCQSQSLRCIWELWLPGFYYLHMLIDLDYSLGFGLR